MINELSGLAAAMPRTPIAELENGQAVDTYFTCSEKTTATDRNGKTYLRLKLRDATGEVSCIHFDPSEEALGVSAGDVVVAGGAPGSGVRTAGGRCRRRRPRPRLRPTLPALLRTGRSGCTRLHRSRRAA